MNMDIMHFKFTHDGSWHRFVLPTRGRKLFPRLKKRIKQVLGVEEQQIWWDDGATLNRLDDSVDLTAAIAFAAQEAELYEGRIPCVYLHFSPDRSEEKEIAAQSNVAVAPAQNHSDADEQRALQATLDELAAISAQTLDSSSALLKSFKADRAREKAVLAEESDRIARFEASFAKTERHLADVAGRTEALKQQNLSLVKETLAMQRNSEGRGSGHEHNYQNRIVAHDAESSLRLLKTGACSQPKCIPLMSSTGQVQLLQVDLPEKTEGLPHIEPPSQEEKILARLGKTSQQPAPAPALPTTIPTDDVPISIAYQPTIEASAYIEQLVSDVAASRERAVALVGIDAGTAPPTVPRAAHQQGSGNPDAFQAALDKMKEQFERAKGNLTPADPTKLADYQHAESPFTIWRDPASNAVKRMEEKGVVATHRPSTFMEQAQQDAVDKMNEELRHALPYLTPNDPAKLDDYQSKLPPFVIEGAVASLEGAFAAYPPSINTPVLAVQPLAPLTRKQQANVDRLREQLIQALNPNCPRSLANKLSKLPLLKIVKQPSGDESGSHKVLQACEQALQDVCSSSLWAAREADHQATLDKADKDFKQAVTSLRPADPAALAEWKSTLPALLIDPSMTADTVHHAEDADGARTTPSSVCPIELKKQRRTALPANDVLAKVFKDVQYLMDMEKASKLSSAPPVAHRPATSAASLTASQKDKKQRKPQSDLDVTLEGVAARSLAMASAASTFAKHGSPSGAKKGESTIEQIAPGLYTSPTIGLLFSSVREKEQKTSPQLAAVLRAIEETEEDTPSVAESTLEADREEMEANPSPTQWNAEDKGDRLALADGNLRAAYAYLDDGAERKRVWPVSVRADQPCPADARVYYFEVAVKQSDGFMGIGLSEKSMKTDRLPGWDEGTYGYHGDDGNFFAATAQGLPYGPTYGSGDVIGCGLNRETRTIFFTKNGENLGIATVIPSSLDGLYPTVGLQSCEAEVEANFGQKPFVYDISSYMKMMDEAVDVASEIENRDGDQLLDYEEEAASSTTPATAAPPPVTPKTEQSVGGWRERSLFPPSAPIIPTSLTGTKISQLVSAINDKTGRGSINDDDEIYEDCVEEMGLPKPLTELPMYAKFAELMRERQRCTNPETERDPSFSELSHREQMEVIKKKTQDAEKCAEREKRHDELQRKKEKLDLMRMNKKRQELEESRRKLLASACHDEDDIRDLLDAEARQTAMAIDAEEKRPVVAKMVKKLILETLAPQEFVLRLSYELHSSPRKNLIPFIETCLVQLRGAIYFGDVISIPDLCDKLADRIIELQSSDDDAINEATFTAAEAIDMLLQQLQQHQKEEKDKKDKKEEKPSRVLAAVMAMCAEQEKERERNEAKLAEEIRVGEKLKKVEQEITKKKKAKYAAAAHAAVPAASLTSGDLKGVLRETATSETTPADPSDEDTKAAVAALVMEVINEQTSSDDFTQRLAEVLNFKPRPPLVSFTEVSIPMVREGLTSGWNRSSTELVETLAERFIELQSSDDSTIIEATMTAHTTIGQMLRELQRPLPAVTLLGMTARPTTGTSSAGVTAKERKAELERKKAKLAEMRNAKKEKEQEVQRQNEARRREEEENVRMVEEFKRREAEEARRVEEEEKGYAPRSNRWDRYAVSESEDEDEEMTVEERKRKEKEQEEKILEKYRQKDARMLQGLKPDEEDGEAKEIARWVKKYQRKEEGEKAEIEEKHKALAEWMEEEEQGNVRMVEKYQEKEEASARMLEDLIQKEEEKETEKRKPETYWEGIRRKEREAEEEARRREEEENVRLVEEYVRKEAEKAKTMEEVDRRVEELLKKSAVQPQSEEEKKEALLNTIRALLDKITSETKDTLIKEFLEMNVYKSKYLNDIVSIIYDKAVDEPTNCALYASLCYEQVQAEVKLNTNNSSLFRNSILYHAQETFTTKQIDEIMKKKQDEIAAETDERRKAVLVGGLISTQSFWRRRKLGNINENIVIPLKIQKSGIAQRYKALAAIKNFIGHMYVHKLVSMRIVLFCVVDLMKTVTEMPERPEDRVGLDVDEESVECAVRLMEVAGAALQEETDKARQQQELDQRLRLQLQQLQLTQRLPQHPNPQVFPMDMVCNTFEKAKPLVNPRLRIMIKNLLKLRKNGWVKSEKKETEKAIRMRGTSTASQDEAAKEKLSELLKGMESELTKRKEDELKKAEDVPEPSQEAGSTDAERAKVEEHRTMTPRELALQREKARISNCVSQRKRIMAHIIAQVIDYGTGEALQQVRDEILQLVNNVTFSHPTARTVVTGFMAAAVEKATSPMGGLEVIPAFGHVLAALLSKQSERAEILEGVAEYCREVVRVERWKFIPNIWEIVAEVMVNAHSPPERLFDPSSNLVNTIPFLEDFKEAFIAANKYNVSKCTLFVTFLEKLAQKQHKRDNMAETLNDIITLIFTQAVEQPELASFLAEMCAAQIEQERAQDVQSFRSAMVVRVQWPSEAEREQEAAMAVKRGEVRHAVGFEDRSVKFNELCAMQRRLKTSKLANIMFFGHLYLHDIIASRIVIFALQDLLTELDTKTYREKVEDADSIECAVLLITLCGKKFHNESEVQSTAEDSRFVSTKTLDSLFATLSAIAMTSDGRIRAKIEQVMMQRANGWKKTVKGTSVGKDTRNYHGLEAFAIRDEMNRQTTDRREGAHTPEYYTTEMIDAERRARKAAEIEKHFVFRDEEKEGRRSVVTVEEIVEEDDEEVEEVKNTLEHEVSCLLTVITANNKPKIVKEFLSFGVEKYHDINKIVSLLFEAGALYPRKVSLYASMCSAQISKEMDKDKDSKFLQGIYDYICDALNPEKTEEMEAALLASTLEMFDSNLLDMYERNLTVEDPKPIIKQRKLDNISFLAEIYLLSPDIELARLLQTCLLNLMQTVSTSRKEEHVELDMESYECAVDILEKTGKMLDSALCAADSQEASPVSPILDTIFDSMKATTSEISGRLGDKVENLIWTRANSWVPKDQALLNHVVYLIDSVSPSTIDQVIDYLLKKKLHDVADSSVLREIISHIFDKAAAKPELGPLYATLCAALVAQEVAKAENGSRLHNVFLVIAHEVFINQKSIQIVSEKEMELSLEGDELLQMPIILELIDLKCEMKKKKLSYVEFIGHLFLEGVVSVTTLNFVVVELLKTIVKNTSIENTGITPDEESIECALRLLKQCGSHLHDEIVKYTLAGDPAPFNMYEAFDDLNAVEPRLSDKLRVMIDELVTLRSHGWVTPSVEAIEEKEEEESVKDIEAQFETEYDPAWIDSGDSSDQEEEEEEEESSDDQEDIDHDNDAEVNEHGNREENEETSDDDDVEELQKPVSVEEAKDGEVKEVGVSYRQPYSPQQTGGEEEYKIESSEESACPSVRSEEQEEVEVAAEALALDETLDEDTPEAKKEDEKTNEKKEFNDGLARQPYSDDEEEKSSSSSDSSSSESSTTSSWSKVSVESALDYSKLDSDQE